MKITIIYDNEARKQGLEADWGFSCVQRFGKIEWLVFNMPVSLHAI